MQNLQNKCGDCRFFCSEKIFDRPCDKLGQIEIAKACKRFKPEATKLKDAVLEATGALELLAKLMRKIPSNSLPTLSAHIALESVTRKYGYCFYQRVYCKIRGQAEAYYLDNFEPCFVMEATKAGLVLYAKDANFKYVKTEFKKGELNGPKIFSPKAFAKLRDQMVRDDKITDPKAGMKKIDQSYLIVKEKASTDVKKTVTINDLVSMTQAIEKGIEPRSGYARERISNLDKNGRYVIGS
jgi:hypothetical protein